MGLLGAWFVGRGHGWVHFLLPRALHIDVVQFACIHAYSRDVAIVSCFLCCAVVYVFLCEGLHALHVPVCASNHLYVQFSVSAIFVPRAPSCRVLGSRTNCAQSHG